jgi:NAD(P)-dependent dehydrogenase (short-subunit alcohol dehydrogenase family)
VSDSATVDRRRLLGLGALAAGALASGKAASQPMPAPRSLAGRSILVTGCSSGFGRLGALLYARQGARVIAAMRNLPRPEAEDLRRLARAEKLDLHVVEIDVLSDQEVARGVAEAERIAGAALDVLVNNAGIGISGPVELQDMAATELMFGTNVFGYQRMARAVLPAMRKRKAGLIVNVSSQLGRVIYPNIGMYSATKFAVEAMSEQLAYELAPRGIEVTIVQPGGYPTDIWRNGDRNTRTLLNRTGADRKAGYPDFVASATRGGGGGSTDPMDVPRAIAEIIAQPAGSRPLRVPVHPGVKPQEPINEVSAKVQSTMLGRSPYAPLAKAVLG